MRGVASIARLKLDVKSENSSHKVTHFVYSLIKSCGQHLIEIEF